MLGSWGEPARSILRGPVNSMASERSAETGATPAGSWRVFAQCETTKALDLCQPMDSSVAWSIGLSFAQAGTATGKRAVMSLYVSTIEAKSAIVMEAGVPSLYV